MAKQSKKNSNTSKRKTNKVEQEYIKFLRENAKRFSKQKNGSYIFAGDCICNCHLYSKSKRNDDPGIIHDELIPEPVLGDLKNAKIIICNINPGYKIGKQINKQTVLNQLFQKNGVRMPYLEELSKNHGIPSSTGSDWWKTRFDVGNGSIIKTIINNYKTKGLDVEIEDVYKMLSKIVVGLELYPYHSSKIHYSYLGCCPSRLKTTELIKSYIELNNDKLICILSGASKWHTNGHRKNVVINKMSQNASLNISSNCGAAILKLVDDLSNNYKKLF